jgi:hypothetical protein
MNRSASSLAKNPGSSSFVYKTPVRIIESAAASRPDLEKDKRTLMKQRDFDLA